MKILYYNWVQFDNEDNLGGGVNVYQYNLIDYLTRNSDNEIYFLSSGFKYNPFKAFPYIKETENVFGDKCKSFEVVNSSIIAPAFMVYNNPQKFTSDTETYDVFLKFVQENGPFDVIHLNNIEGISINVLKIKELYPNTKFILSIHNYQPICPLVQYFQNHNQCICNDFNEGKECIHCANFPIKKQDYVKRCRKYLEKKFPAKFLKLPIKLFATLFKFRAVSYIGKSKTKIAENYKFYRDYNIQMINKYIDSVLAVSQSVANIMLAHGVNPKIVKTSYIGTKFAQVELRHSIAQSTRPFTIAYLGYERIDKGYYFLIEALSKLPKHIAEKMNVVLAVKNIHKNRIRGKLDNFNSVIIHNGYSHSELNNILAEVNLGIVPVLWEDNLPQVAIEMVACGVPILCSGFGGASELCDSELFKFAGGEEEEFIKRLTKLVEEPALLEEYWAYHKPLMTMERHIKELEEYYGINGCTCTK